MEGIVICSGGMVDVEGVPEEIKILPLGHVHSQKGDFEVDDESVELIRKQFKSRKLDLVIDYDIRRSKMYRLRQEDGLRTFTKERMRLSQR